LARSSNTRIKGKNESGRRKRLPKPDRKSDERVRLIQGGLIENPFEYSELMERISHEDDKMRVWCTKFIMWWMAVSVALAYALSFTTASCEPLRLVYERVSPFIHFAAGYYLNKPRR
jgi:hypothetical protein